MSDEELVVQLDAADLGERAATGRLRYSKQRGASVLSFAYEPEWLRANHRLVLDPSLGRFEGDQYAADGKLFGIFADTAPDRWGRMLLQRREAALARREARRPMLLDEWDFLVGVNDELRTGALRLWDPTKERFVDDGAVSVPPVARLRQLEYYASRAERGEALSVKEEDEELALLVAPGSSLGGNRPKANFRAEDGLLWIAKFPSRTDAWDVEVWEYIACQLATAAGISVAPNRLIDLGQSRHTFASERFDRTTNDRRLFASALTLLGKRDHDPASYLEMAEAIAQFGDSSAVKEDLAQLFRRVAFNVLIGHRDDHLRNHGFLGTLRGWRLAPGFDINPLPNKAEHVLALDESIQTPDVELVIETARYYRIKSGDAVEIVRAIKNSIRDWRMVARAVGAQRDEIDLMAPVFEARDGSTPAT